MSEPTIEKRVSWAELFFDLVFVFAITQVSALLLGNHTGLGLLRAAVVFVPIYWAWVGSSIQANLRNTEQLTIRFALFAVALAGLLMALGVPQAYGDRGVLFGAAYFGGRIVLALVATGGRHFAASPFTVAVSVSGPLLLIGGFLPSAARTAVWAVAALIDLSTPTVLKRRLAALRFDAGHLSERFGTFVLIAIGETVVAIGAPVAASDQLSAAVLLAVAVAFAIAVGLWWVYFHFAADAIRFALQTAKVQVTVSRHVLSYAHLFFIGAIIAVAVGMHEAIARPSEPLAWSVAALLYGGSALYLATFGYSRWMMFHLVSKTRLTAAAMVLILLPVAPRLPALLALTVLAVALAALNVIELRTARHAAAVQ
ncbi:MAG: low temperature requirement protein A [Actinomycetota bacterium]|nr:low temperature requirement protein A [Actinomycetota bacterium]